MEIKKKSLINLHEKRIGGGLTALKNNIIEIAVVAIKNISF
jgi:hypothetical protein